MSKDYLANLKLEPGDKLDYGVPGMKWGRRMSDSGSGSSTSGSSKSGGSKGTGSSKAPPPKAPENEKSSDRYTRLRSQIKTHGANSLEPEDLNFVTSRTEAIAKVNKMNVAHPGWLHDASKVVLQETTKTLMKDLAREAGKEFIVKPLLKGAIKR